MRWSIGEIDSESEINEYIDSIKNLTISEIFEIYISNNKALYNHPEMIYDDWRKDFETGVWNISKQKVIALAASDKFYIDEDEMFDFVKSILSE